MELAGPEPELQSGEDLPDLHLADFTRLGTQIFLYTPTETHAKVGLTPESTAQPDLIIICSWMYAASRYIKKYTKAYQTRYPSSSILLLRQDGGDLFWRTVRQQVQNMEPAVSVVQRHVKTKQSSQSKVLLHIFSNGGSYTACLLADTYLSSSNQLLPIAALVFDSTPSLPSAARSHTAICEALPKSIPARAIGSAAVWAYLGIGYVLDKVGGKENIIMTLRRKLNHPQGAFMQRYLNRLYIYSQADPLIPAEDVEQHAREAAAVIGNGRVEMADFVSSRHVGHVMLDERRYWNVIETLWNKSLEN
ncbi:uncharacterized protein Z518_03406 [Rhinocladiella mackenziei CBS 650.93]|uniref:Indole-diterpene biosynthesis protein PaxU n=1 Tax=Rhinocladiella mackenziei CBS 650.93 TaxID=1442369 RepID=A0A0D2IRX8_9EURO|nr:uncharacterized protein Z518_03406 [Rhinocladiella mackenziei CBS 650.93]KIX08749.1 hypothetical protein Z518_03406 [Rhinocladiella mackenziei CBS 650.93]